MSQLSDIREGLAANLCALRANGTVGQVSAYLLANPTPPALMVAGVEAGGFEYLTFHDESVRWTILVEACLGETSDVGAQKTLNALLAPGADTSVVAAVEADDTLTGRLLDDGTVQTGQAAACDSLAFSGYRGQSMFVLPNGVHVLLATWAFDVVT